MPATETRIRFRGYETWCRVVGEAEDDGKLPVVCLHGGPGGTHDYIESLEALAETGRRAVFYDQLGCGRSDQPHDPSLWTVELFLEEIDTVRAALGLAELHLLGQSWGGMLGQGRQYLDTAWWLSTFPGLAIMLTTLAISRGGDWVRDILDPTLRSG